MDDGEAMTVRVVGRMAEIAAADWDRCANPDPATFNPFLAHAFLDALEAAGTTGARPGWLPRWSGLGCCEPEHRRPQSDSTPWTARRRSPRW